jgi:hypothetical protein
MAMHFTFSQRLQPPFVLQLLCSIQSEHLRVALHVWFQVRHDKG